LVDETADAIVVERNHSWLPGHQKRWKYAQPDPVRRLAQRTAHLSDRLGKPDHNILGFAETTG